ncbi:MAG TPA: YkuS family protein [Thermoanaerobacterales bacterium]|nr:YkuS family protein [Thermoanaerobacterales bacterium]
MTRVIALEDGLEDIGEYLRSRGYKTVSWGEPNTVIDAVVYTGRKLENIYETTYNRIIDPLSGDTGEEYPYGVLLVNAQDRTPEEIYEIIKNRVYEHFI